MKKVIKSIMVHLPPKASTKMYALFRALVSYNVFWYDKTMFLKYYSKDIYSSDYTQLSVRLVFHSHSIEKGLSHREIRYGFGESTLRVLAIAIDEYKAKDFDRTDRAYVNALSVIGAYIKLHKDAKKDLHRIKLILGAEIFTEAEHCPAKIGGVATLDVEGKNNNKTKNFNDLFQSRHSVREFSNEPVDPKKINEVIEIVRKTPTVCNRQAMRLHVVSNAKTIEGVLTIQGGFTGYKTPPLLLMLTTDVRGYISLTERRQPYIDGGLYAMSILLALEFVGLAACSLNAMFTRNQDRLLRKMLRIEPSETVIMFIAVGNFYNKNKVAKSFRYSSDKIKRVHT